MTLRYEDLAGDTARILPVLMSQIGLEFEPQQLRFADCEHHQVAGNHLRMTHDSSIRLDQQYLSPGALSTLRWFAATVLALPLLHRYGYSVVRSCN